ncbi:TetR family transcriptional regulator [Pseudomonas sp.]|uniref:TetR/AcrR family transcriptional regulator n=1 Tax=Pseudomonas sp. TaxID=306 RepID=UPI001B2C75C5|nr:TetR family transcriptional regulator [Pseudomonas sp.]MBO9547975.1 TetR family transcriptional regulator [Pseudomonas sp.]
MPNLAILAGTHRSEPSMPRPKKHDLTTADSKALIIDAALQVIRQEGAGCATYRRIAAEAGVSPGTMTYHFANINEIVAAAFVKMSNGIADQYFRQLGEARDTAHARELVADLICGDLWKASGQMLLIFELYTFVSRNPEYTYVMDDWMARSRQALQIHFDEKTARALDALIEGFTIHNALSKTTVSRADILALIEAIA